MAVRYDDAGKVVSLSARDLAELGFASPNLELELAMSRRRRLEEARLAHRVWQEEQSKLDPGYTAEATLKTAAAIEGWTIRVHARLDGWSREGERPVVEEVKTVALDEGRLANTSAADWTEYVAQLRVYLWMLDREGHPDAIGRLILVSVLDGSRRVLGVEPELPPTGARILRFLTRLVLRREARIAWIARRRTQDVPFPHPTLRPGQQQILDQARRGLEARAAVLVQAPTGLGKTAAVLCAALRRAFAEGKQVVWVTARGTQQRAALAAAHQLAARGVALRVVTVVAREKVCLNAQVHCRAEACAFARLHHEKVERGAVLEGLWKGEPLDRGKLRSIGLEHEVCPYQIAADAARTADLVVCDYNYVFDPDMSSGGVMGDDPSGWILVVDEAHQLPERVRGYGSPSVTIATTRKVLEDHRHRPGYQGFVAIAHDVEHVVREALRRGGGEPRRVELDLGVWSRFAAAVDAVAVEHAMLAARRDPAEGPDPWVDFARSILRFRDTLERAGEETVACVDPDREALRLICLDPSSLAGTRIARFAGSILMSATLSPAAFYRDVLGLGDHVEEVVVPWPFRKERRAVLIAPRVSTRFEDRPREAAPTAKLLGSLVEAVPGNVAIYFSSFAMLDDIVGRLSWPGRRLLRQTPEDSEEERARALDLLQARDQPTVLAAVLGGVFAEGVDLPDGALSAVLVVGPAFPPVGLERSLLHEHYERRYRAGFLYASLVPGLTKVIQAAGRVVRGPDDVGAVVLIDRRFRHRQILDLLPADWPCAVPEDPARALRDFFASARVEVGVEVVPRSGEA